jgi:hypothetical protein
MNCEIVYSRVRGWFDVILEGEVIAAARTYQIGWATLEQVMDEIKKQKEAK